MKYQFQFAGANVSRRSSPPRKRMRIALLVVAFILALLAYWQYLQHLTQPARRVATNAREITKVTATAATTVKATTAGKVASAATAATTTATTTPAVKATPSDSTATAPIATATATTVPAAKPISTEASSVPVIKKAADTAIALVKHVLPASLSATPAAPDQSMVETAPPSVSPVATTSAQPATQSQTEPGSVSVLRITSQPPPPPTKPRVRPPEEQLQRAGMTAFDNAMTLAAKYPDAYGFQAATEVEDATLGKPIPVYTIEEADRVKYTSGQPIKPLLKPMNAWAFPVLANDRVCCMVQVKYTGHEYVPTRSSKLLGTAWDKIITRWPESEGYHPCIVVNPAIPGYFFTVPELPTQNLTDIISLTYFHPNLSPADVILASWR